MKYIVEIKYTNPGHEHVSLRRRVDTVSRVVEASNEDEALNRAANQQRALGFRIQEAKVINEEQRTTTFPLGGGVVNLPKNLPSEKDGTAKLYDPKKDEKKLSPSAMMKKEEVEQIDEGKAHDRITAGLKDENPNARVDAILHPKATPEHISIALKDEHPHVREAAVRHRNATSEHISTGLKDDHMIVRKAAIKNRNASSENISAALKDGDIYTRMNAIKHRNVKPEHIAIALKDKESYVRDAAKKRMTKEEVFIEEESIEEAKQVDHAKTIAKSLAATHPNFTVSSFNGDHGRAHVVHHKSDTRNFKNGEQLMGPNIQLQHNHKTNKVHMEMQGDYDNVPDRDEETHHPDKAHDAAHKMFKPAIDLIHKTDKKTTNEEVEQLDEGKLGKALAVGALSLASMGAKAHSDTTKSVAQLSHERPAVSALLHKIGATGQVPASDKRAAELQRKQDQEMPASERRAKELKNEEVDADKRDAGYKMSPAVRAAQKKSDELSKVVKRPQAGTLAAVHKSMERTMERNMKKEAADPGSMRVVNKKVKAADKMINAAKKAATVNLEPELKITRPMV